MHECTSVFDASNNQLSGEIGALPFYDSPDTFGWFSVANNSGLRCELLAFESYLHISGRSVRNIPTVRVTAIDVSNTAVSITPKFIGDLASAQYTVHAVADVSTKQVTCTDTECGFTGGDTGGCTTQSGDPCGMLGSADFCASNPSQQKCASIYSWMDDEVTSDDMCYICVINSITSIVRYARAKKPAPDVPPDVPPDTTPASSSVVRSRGSFFIVPVVMALLVATTSVVIAVAVSRAVNPL